MLHARNVSSLIEACKTFDHAMAQIFLMPQKCVVSKRTQLCWKLVTSLIAGSASLIPSQKTRTLSCLTLIEPKRTPACQQTLIRHCSPSTARNLSCTQTIFNKTSSTSPPHGKHLKSRNREIFRTSFDPFQGRLRELLFLVGHHWSSLASQMIYLTAYIVEQTESDDALEHKRVVSTFVIDCNTLTCQQCRSESDRLTKCEPVLKTTNRTISIHSDLYCSQTVC